MTTQHKPRQDTFSTQRDRPLLDEFSVCCLCKMFLTRQDKTKTRHDKTKQDKTRQDKTRHDTTRQGTTRQDKTRQDKTRQDKTRQDKTRQDEVGVRQGYWARIILRPQDQTPRPNSKANHQITPRSKSQDKLRNRTEENVTVCLSWSVTFCSTTFESTFVC
jgi:hypothetical protein